MADEIKGVAILDRTNPEVQYLYCLGYRDGKQPTFIHIPVYPRNAPKPQAHAWQYDIQGNRLNVTPSVKVSTTQPPNNQEVEIFHNGGQWNVEFRDKVADAYEELYAAHPEARAARDAE